MNETRLNQIAENFLRNHYGVDLDIPVKRNNRLRSTYGRFMIRNNEPHCIEIAGVLLDYGAKEVISNILKHECIHYALYKKQMPHRDGNPVFEKELKKHGAPQTRKLIIGKFYIIQCHKCGKTGLTDRKRTVAQPENYRMSCCNTKVKIVGERIFDGSNMD